jgi:hypothetical protein
MLDRSAVLGNEGGLALGDELKGGSDLVLGERQLLPAESDLRAPVVLLAKRCARGNSEVPRAHRFCNQRRHGPEKDPPLHNQTALWLKVRLLFRNGTVVTSIPSHVLEHGKIRSPIPPSAATVRPPARSPT